MLEIYASLVNRIGDILYKEGSWCNRHYKYIYQNPMRDNDVPKYVPIWDDNGVAISGLYSL